MSEKRRPPRFNHVAMSMPADALDEQGRADIVRFYKEVFGWEELPTETVDRKKLVMSAYRYDQFVFLIADDPPMATPPLDHFGMGVDTVEELDDFLDRATARARALLRGVDGDGRTRAHHLARPHRPDGDVRVVPQRRAPCQAGGLRRRDVRRPSRLGHRRRLVPRGVRGLRLGVPPRA